MKTVVRTPVMKLGLPSSSFCSFGGKKMESGSFIDDEGGTQFPRVEEFLDF